MKVQDGGTLFGLLEDGQLSRDFVTEIQEAIVKTREAVGSRETGKCTVSMKLSMNVEGDGVTFTAEFSSSVPKAPREKTFLFVDKKGVVSTESLRQTSMFEEKGRKASDS